jgi:hypothetical protein
MLQYLIGADPTHVFARAAAPAGGPAASFVVSIGFADGSVGTILYADGTDEPTWRERVDLFGRGLACSLEDFKRATLTRGGRVQQMRRAEAARGYHEELTAWVRAVRGEAPAPVEISAYAANTACCLAAVDSARTGLPVAVEWAGAESGTADDWRYRG